MNKQTSPPETTGTLPAYPTKEVQIIFRENANIDLASCKVFSLSVVIQRKPADITVDANDIRSGEK